MKRFYLSFAVSNLLLPFIALAQSTGQIDINNVVPDIASPQSVGGRAGVINWIQAFYQFSLIAGVFLAVGVITWAGLKYALAAGNPSGQSDARDQILQALLGLILLFGAYIVLYTINPNLVNLKLDTLSDVRVGTPPALPGGCTDCYADDLSRTILGNNGIKVNAGEPRTSVAGLRQLTLNEALSIKAKCDCNIEITAGTERDSHSDNGTYTHVNGYKIDVAPNDKLDVYIAGSFDYIGERKSDGALLYRAPSGTVYARELDHWDICVDCK